MMKNKMTVLNYRVATALKQNLDHHSQTNNNKEVTDVYCQVLYYCKKWTYKLNCLNDFLQKIQYLRVATL